MRDYILVYINGERHELRGEQAFMPLSSFLRNQLRLTGTKVVCAEGDCGACTVALGRMNGGKLKYQSVNSCIARMFQLDCSSIVSVEGLHEDGKAGHVAQVFAENHGAQCGFCTPGFVCSMALMFETKTAPTAQDVKNACTGNLCRCTGYKSIIEAGLKMEPAKVQRISSRYNSQAMITDIKDHHLSDAKLIHNDSTFFRPSNLADALSFLDKHADCRIYGAGTDLGVLHNKKKLSLSKIMDVQHIPELKEISETAHHIEFGAAVTLHRLEEVLEKQNQNLSQFYRVFASPQIKHLATLAGNIANASPIGDSMPPLMILGAELCVTDLEGDHWLPISEFFLAYRKTKLKQGQIIKTIRLPKSAPENFRVYKLAKRKDLDISTVSAAFALKLKDKKIESLSIALGGVAEKPIRLPAIEAKVQGKTLDSQTIKEIKDDLATEINPLDDHRGSAWYRKTLVTNLFDKYVSDIGGPHGNL